jgi:hypothetical protein
LQVSNPQALQNGAKQGHVGPQWGGAVISAPSSRASNPWTKSPTEGIHNYCLFSVLALLKQPTMFLDASIVLLVLQYIPTAIGSPFPLPRIDDGSDEKELIGDLLTGITSPIGMWILASLILYQVTRGFNIRVLLEHQ